MTALAPLPSQPVATVQIRSPSVRKGRPSPWARTRRSSAALCTSVVSPGRTGAIGGRGSRELYGPLGPSQSPHPRTKDTVTSSQPSLYFYHKSTVYALEKVQNPSKHNKMKILSSDLLDILLSTLECIPFQELSMTLRVCVLSKRGHPVHVLFSPATVFTFPY